MKTKTRSTAKRKMLAITLGLVVFAMTAASAATLGGINSSDLGAVASVVASCDSDGITVDYTYAFDAGIYEVDTVELSDIDASCDGQDVELALFDSADADLGGGTDVADGTGALSIDVSADDVDTEAVEGVAIVISG